MLNRSVLSWFVGTACDGPYARHTAAMLASLDVNGDVPEVTVLIAAFDLQDEHRALIRAGAGRLAARLRFIDIRPEMINFVAAGDWQCPTPIFGRFFFTDAITVPGARLLCMDSDMIVNGSLRTLFETDMNGEFLAACHDVPRHDDFTYFNAGLMLIDVDGYQHHEISRRSIDWLSQQQVQPRWLDQDALNTVVGHRWLRLDDRWNFHCLPHGSGRPLVFGDYEAARIAHFAAIKPWNDTEHAGFTLYDRYRKEVARRVELHRAMLDHADANFVITAHEFLLADEHGGDDPEAWAGATATEVLRRLVHSDLFIEQVMVPLALGQSLTEYRPGEVGVRLRRWAAERLPLSDAAATCVRDTADWRAMFVAILTDDTFTTSVDLRSSARFLSHIMGTLAQAEGGGRVKAPSAQPVPAEPSVEPAASPGAAAASEALV